MTRGCDKIEPNAFQQLVAAINSDDTIRIEQEAERIARAVLKSHKPQPRRSAQRIPTK
ncbi:MAG TPA: hypothetical protein VFE60_28335 [Roseiarcus sp.]|nr:hypothetical protein [Roseiarcus sp.]